MSLCTTSKIDLKGLFHKDYPARPRRPSRPGRDDPQDRTGVHVGTAPVPGVVARRLHEDAEGASDAPVAAL